MPEKIADICNRLRVWDPPDTVPSVTPIVAILGTRYPDFAVETEILGSEVTIVSATGASPDEIVETTRGAQVILAGSIPRFDRGVIERLDGCRAIVRSGIGVDSIDLVAAREAGIWVAYVPDYGTEAVAQHTLALALAATRRLGETDRLVKRGDWGFADLRPLHLPGSMTAGVVGYGRIGKRVAELLAAVGFERILAHDPYAHPTGTTVEFVGLTDLLSRSDVVCLHAPGPADGRPLLGTAQLACLKPGSVLVNASRGNLVDVEALAVALHGGAPRIAALDVFEPEPPDLAPFDGVVDRLILSPHMAWYTEESQADLRRKSAEEAKRLLAGSPPLHPIVTPEETT